MTAILSIFFALLVTLGYHLLPYVDSWFEVIYRMLFDFLAVLTLAPLFAAIVLARINSREGSQILVSETGISFPRLNGWLPGLFNLIPWSDIVGLSISTSNPSSVRRSDSVGIRKRDGQMVNLFLLGLEQADQEKLFVAFDSFARNAERDVNIEMYQRALQAELSGLECNSYTSIWESELARRFKPASFVPLKPGKTLMGGSLRVERQLSFGGFSAVYLVRDDQNKQFVLKELVGNMQGEKGAKVKELFYREAEILARLNHPRLTKVVTHFNEDAREYMLLEYLPGVNLRQYVHAYGVIPPEKVVTFIEDMLSILEYLHGREPPVVHRDFTPDNLVLSENDEIYVIDFGASCQFLSDATGTIIGKQSYMPPEQVRGKAVPASDMFALGATIYFLLTGEDPPALTSSRPSKLHKQTVPLHLDEIVHSLTQMDPEHRPNPSDVRKKLKEEGNAILELGDSIQVPATVLKKE